MRDASDFHDQQWLFSSRNFYITSVVIGIFIGTVGKDKVARRFWTLLDGNLCRLCEENLEIVARNCDVKVEELESMKVLWKFGKKM